jgi:hypothetical protein
MYISNDKCKLAHNQIRVATATDKSIIYQKGRCYTAVNGYAEPRGALDDEFGIEFDTVQTYAVSKDGISKLPKIFTKVISSLRNYYPEVLIDANNLSEKTYSYYGKGLYGGAKKKYEYSFRNGLWGQYEIDDDDDKIIDDFDLFEVNSQFQYVWDPTSLKGKDRKEYLDGLREEILLNSDHLILEDVRKLNDIEVIKIANLYGILAKNLKKVKYDNSGKNITGWE